MKSYYCKKCGDKVSSITKYCKKQGCYTYDVIEKYECPAMNCSEHFIEMTELNEHITLNPVCKFCHIHVNDNDIVSHDEELHPTCQFCGRQFEDYIALIVHYDDDPCQKEDISKIKTKIDKLKAKLKSKDKKIVRKISQEIEELEDEMFEKYQFIYGGEVYGGEVELI